MWIRTLLSRLLLLGSITLASSASASVYYIRTDGHDTASGLNNTTNASTGAWQNTAKANSVLIAGDRVYYISPPADSATVGIFPTHNGTSSAAIEYYGDGSNPTGYPVASITLQQKYIRVRGVKSKDAAAMLYSTATNRPQGCVITNSVITNHLVFRGAINCKVDSCSATLTGANGSNCIDFGNSDDPARYIVSDTLSNNTFALGPFDGQARGMLLDGYANNCLFRRNRFNISCNLNGASGSTSPDNGWVIRHSYNCRFEDNHYVFESVGAAPTNGWELFVGRSSSFRHYFLRDTMDVFLNSTPVNGFMILGQGNDNNCSATGAPAFYLNNTDQCNRGQSRYIFDACVFRSRNLDYRWGLDSTLVKNSVFLTNGLPAIVLWSDNGTTFTNNTFGALQSTDPALQLRSTSSQVIADLTLRGNIFYKPAGSSVGGLQLTASSSLPLDAIKSNYNLFCNWGNAGTPGDRSIRWSTDGGSSWQTSLPGYGTLWYNTGNNKDGASGYAGIPPGWGPMAFTDTTSISAFNPTLTASSAALTRNYGCTDCGALQYSVGIDAPTTIEGFTASQVSDYGVALTWIAPEAASTNCKAVADYEWEFSLSSIDEGNFVANNLFGGWPAPAQPGVIQSWTITNACPGKTYYVAIRAVDAFGVHSPIATTVITVPGIDDGTCENP